MNPLDAQGAVRATPRVRRTALASLLDRHAEEHVHGRTPRCRGMSTGAQQFRHATARRICTLAPRERTKPERNLARAECLVSMAGSNAMNRDEIVELHYICPIETVPSILEHGILSHKAAARVTHRSIANEAVQERRAEVKIPGGKKLHSYVNLYFNGRNPMMFTLCKNEGNDSVCLLRVNSDVIDLPGVVITDRNASTSAVRFAEPGGGLALIESNVIFAEYWTHSDHFKQLDHKARMCAEVLVPSIVDTQMIVGAYVGSKNARKMLRRLAPEFPVSVDKYKFFG